MRSLFAGLTVILAFSLLACGNKGKEQAEACDSLQQKMCACSDVGCAHGVAVEFKDWLTKNKEVKVSASNRTKIEASMKKMAECATKLQEPGADSLDDSVPEAED